MNHEQLPDVPHPPNPVADDEKWRPAAPAAGSGDAKPLWLTDEIMEYAKEAKEGASRDVGSAVLEDSVVVEHTADTPQEERKEKELEAASTILQNVDEQHRARLFDFGDKSAKYILASENPNEDQNRVEQLRREAIAAEQSLDPSISSVASDYRVHVTNASRYASAQPRGESTIKSTDNAAISTETEQEQAIGKEIPNEISAEEKKRLKNEFQNIFRALEGANHPATLERTSVQIFERARKMYQGDMKLASYGTAIGASEDPRFISDVFTKVLDPELRSSFGDNYPKVRKILANIVRTHGDIVDPWRTRGDEKIKLQNKAELSTRIARDAISGDYANVADLADDQVYTLRRMMLGIATGMSPSEQRPRIAQELMKSFVD